MSNTLSAAATGLPAISRRLFMRSAAPAAALAAIPPVSVVFATSQVAAETAEEAPELLDAVAAFDRLAAEHTDARASLDRACAQARALWPSAPKAIRRGGGPGSLRGDRRCLITGGHCIENGERINFHPEPAGYYRDWLARPTRVSTSAKVQRELARYRQSQERELALAEAYEAECERVRLAVGYREAVEAEQIAGGKRCRGIGVVREIEARTPAGLAMKARVFLAEIDPYSPFLPGAEFARNVMAVLGA